MAVFFTITLILSAFGMIVLLSLKRYELRTGHVFLLRMRPRVGAFFTGSLVWLERVLPALVAREIRHAYMEARTWLKAAMAWVIIVTEGLLERGLHLLRRKTDVPHHGEASAFLREVAEHKKKLLQDRAEEE